MRIDCAFTLLCFLPLLPSCTATEAASAQASAAPAARLSDSELEARVARGRALLEAGKPAEAEAVFAEAAQGDAESLRTRMWVLRSWMDQGRSNDTLDALDALDRSGEKGMEMTYLYGMAFARRAAGYVADGVADSSVQMNFLDATSFLKQAVDADAARYRDGFLPLAQSAWYVGDLDTARWAADKAVGVYAGEPEAWLARGRIAMAQFLSAEGEEPDGERGEALWTQASVSFRRAVDLYGRPGTPEVQASLALAATQLGHAMIWRQKGPEATEAYATAMAYDPQGFDYGQCYQLLQGAIRSPEDERPSGFRPALELARTRFEAHARSGDPRAAMLNWWLGWARFSEADWSGSEEAFQASLALMPEYANAWFYVGLARQYRKDSEGALTAMHAGWDKDPTAMVQTAAGAGGALTAFEELIAWCASQEPARNLDAAFLAEMLAEAMPNDARHWNNLGLFLRDEGEGLEIAAYKNKTPAPEEAVLADLYGRAFRAYQRALELNPGDPQLINDTALMLDYHLEGDPAEIEALYRHALELVEARLAESDLGEDDRARFEQTKSDIGVNLERLLHPEALEEAGAGEKEKAAEEKDPAQEGTAAAASTGGG